MQSGVAETLWPGSEASGASVILPGACEANPSLSFPIGQLKGQEHTKVLSPGFHKFSF